jgi:hypothetical protein
MAINWEKYHLAKKKELNIINTIAFYDFDPTKVKLKECFYYMVDLMASLKVMADYMATDYNKKIVLFKNGLILLEKKGFEGTNHFTLQAVQPESVFNSLDFYDFMTIVSNKETPRSVICMNSVLKTFEYEYYEKLMLNQLNFYSFNYAIYYEREYKYGPEWYSAGVGCDGNKYEAEGKEISNWGNRYNAHYQEDPEFAYYTGLLRDIYPINIIIKDHLNQRVGKGTLEEWIKSGDRRGTLHKLTDKHYSWRVPHEDIDSIRQALIPWRLLVAFNKIYCTPRTMTQEQIDELVASGNW